MNKKKVLSLALASMLGVSVFGSFAACGEEEEKKSSVSGENVKLYTEGMAYTETTKGTAESFAKLSFKFLGDDVMPIGSFWGPYASGGSDNGNAMPDFASEEIVKGFSEAGINLVVHSNDAWQDGSANTGIRQKMEYFKKYGVGYFITIDWVTADIGEFNKDVPLDKMQLSTQKGIDKLQRNMNDILADDSAECIVGMYCRDEPFTNMLDNYKVVTDVFYNKLEGMTDLHCYGNYLGYWEDENNLFGYSDPLEYDAYLQKASEINLPMYSCTMYPFTSANTPETSLSAIMYDHLSVYRKYSQELGVPMWRMLQAGGQWNDAQAWIPSVDPYPSFAETLYDVNLALAYGAKAIQYFPGIQPKWFAYEEGGTYDYDRCGLYSADGNKTRWYYAAQVANEQVAAVDEYLMNSANVGVIVHGKAAEKAFITDSQVEKEEIITSKKFRQLKAVGGDDCLIGCFDYKGGTALYVVNYSRTESADVELGFDRNDYRYNVIQRAESVDVVGGKIPLTLAPGEGALVVLY